GSRRPASLSDGRADGVATMARQPGEPRGSTFRTLILALRGRAGLTQRQLATRSGASERSIQAWESGLSYPTAERLKALIAVYVQRGVFAPHRASEEASTLWDAATLEAPRLNTPFDQVWFDALLTSSPGQDQPPMATPLSGG